MTPSARMWTPYWEGQRNKNSIGSEATIWNKSRFIVMSKH